MIPVTPLQGSSILVNADLIEAVEQLPDTVLVLANGRRMVVLDSPADIVARIRHVRAAILAYADDLLDHGKAEVVRLHSLEGGEAR